jgi:hypothetical protein
LSTTSPSRWSRPPTWTRAAATWDQFMKLDFGRKVLEQCFLCSRNITEKTFRYNSNRHNYWL